MFCVCVGSTFFCVADGSCWRYLDWMDWKEIATAIGGATALLLGLATLFLKYGLAGYVQVEVGNELATHKGEIEAKVQKEIAAFKADLAGDAELRRLVAMDRLKIFRELPSIIEGVKPAFFFMFTIDFTDPKAVRSVVVVLNRARDSLISFQREHMAILTTAQSNIIDRIGQSVVDFAGAFQQYDVSKSKQEDDEWAEQVSSYYGTFFRAQQELISNLRAIIHPDEAK
jgi:hypothetical protein